MNKKSIRIIILISFAVILTPNIFYFFNFHGFHGTFSNDDQSWANFGNFTGGVISSIFSFGSFVLLLYTLLQDKEMKNIEKIENRFFKFMDMLLVSRTNCYVKLEMPLKLEKYGLELFNDFNVLYTQVFSFDQIYNISKSETRSEDEQKEYDEFYLKYKVERAAISAHIELIKIILAYIINNDKEREYYKILNTQLDVNEKTAFALIYPEEIKNESYKQIFSIGTIAMLDENVIKRVNEIINNYSPKI